MTRISKRDNLVEFQYPVEGALSTTGKPTITWQRHGRLWISMKQAGGAEGDNGGQLQRVATYTCAMIASDASQVTTRWRIVRGSEVYNIINIDNTDRKEWILTIARNESASVE